MGQAESSSITMAAASSGSSGTGGATGLGPGSGAGQLQGSQKVGNDANNESSAESKGDKYQRLVIELVSRFPDQPPWRLDAIAIKYSFETHADDSYEEEVARLLDVNAKPEETAPFKLHWRQPGISKVDSHDPVEAGIARAEDFYKRMGGAK